MDIERRRVEGGGIFTQFFLRQSFFFFLLFQINVVRHHSVDIAARESGAIVANVWENTAFLHATIAVFGNK